MTAKTKNFEMEYRLLGDTGLKVSVLGLGAMTFTSVDKTIQLMSTARKYGINFYDNAEAYGDPIRGTAEINFGKALKILQAKDERLWRRSDLVITTKIFFGPQAGNVELSPNRSQIGVNELGLSRKHIMEGINDSLKRMQLDYVDIVYAHRPDPLTSVEDIVRSFTNIVRSNKAFFWGTSMWKKEELIEAYWIAKMYNLIPPVVEQPIYSMFTRDVVEYEYLHLFNKRYNLATTIWNVLDRGMLTGKYVKGKNLTGVRLDGKSRLGKFVGGQEYIKDEKNAKVMKLMKIAKQMNVSVTCLAIGWALKNGNVTVCILGATKTSQLEDSVGAIKAAQMLDKKRMDEIEQVLQNKPQPQLLDYVIRRSKKIISRL